MKKSLLVAVIVALSPLVSFAQASDGNTCPVGQVLSGAYCVSTCRPGMVCIESSPTADTLTNSCLSLKYQLTLGSTDATTNGEVTKVQDFLHTRNYLTVAPTGFYGDLTTAAVKQYQTDHGIEAVGDVGPLTRASMNSISCGGMETVTSSGTTAGGTTGGSTSSGTCPAGQTLSGAYCVVTGSSANSSYNSTYSNDLISSIIKAGYNGVDLSGGVDTSGTGTGGSTNSSGGGLKCPGFDRVVEAHWDWNAFPGHFLLDTVHAYNEAGLGPNGILVVDFTPPGPADTVENAALISAVGYPAPNEGNMLSLGISTSPCTLWAPDPGAATDNAPTVVYSVGAVNHFWATGAADAYSLTPGVKYYINVASRANISQGSQGTNTCLASSPYYPHCDFRLEGSITKGHGGTVVTNSTAGASSCSVLYTGTGNNCMSGGNAAEIKQTCCPNGIISGCTAGSGGVTLVCN